MKGKKIMSLLLAGALTAGMLAGCGGKAGSTADQGIQSSSSGTTADGEVDTSKEVELVMYVVSDRPAGQDVVDENLNKLLKEKLNCTLKINWIPWSDYINRYPLLFSSGEKVDLVYTSSWLNYSSLAQKGAFKNLDELWPTYAPKNFAAASEDAKKQATVDGHYYCIPTRLATYRAFGPTYRTDILEGTDWDGKMETFEDIEEYLDLVKENAPELDPLMIYSAGSDWDDTYMYSKGYLSSKGQPDDFLWYDASAENPQLMPYWEIPEVKDFLEMMTRWNEKGFFSKSALADTDATKLQNGKAAMRTHNLDFYRDQSILNPEYKLEFADMCKYSAHLPYTQDALAIANTSENPERALMLWDLITSDQEVYDAFYYGVKDVSYSLNDEGQFEILDPDLYSVSACWAARTDELNREQVGTPEGYGEYKQQFEDAIAADDTFEKWMAFTIDTSGIETEYAACISANQQYWWPLELGYTDSESGLEEYKQAMEAAGIDKVRETLQSQLDEYVKTLK